MNLLLDVGLCAAPLLEVHAALLVGDQIVEKIRLYVMILGHLLQQVLVLGCPILEQALLHRRIAVR